MLGTVYDGSEADDQPENTEGVRREEYSFTDFIDRKEHSYKEHFFACQEKDFFNVIFRVF